MKHLVGQTSWLQRLSAGFLIRASALALLTLSPLFSSPLTTLTTKKTSAPSLPVTASAVTTPAKMRAGLSLESYNGVMKGGGSGDIVIAGRPASSMLYKAVAREEGAPQMPLGQAKIPDAEIAIIRDWIRAGPPGNPPQAFSKGPTGPSLLDFTPSN